MVKEEKYVRRKRAINISIIFMLIVSWFNYCLSPLYQPRPKANASSMSDNNTPATNSTTTTSETTTTTSTSTTTTTTTSTTSTTTTESTTTTTSTTTVVIETTSEEIKIEEPVEKAEADTSDCTDESAESNECVEEVIQAEYAPGEYPDGYVFSSGYVKGSADYIMLCNTVGHEYGSDFVAIEEKAKVAAVVMNRVNSSLYPNTIYEVLVQKNQFNPYYADANYHTRVVTYSVKAAVDWYLDIGYADSNYSWMYSYSGDGTWNYFK